MARRRSTQVEPAADLGRGLMPRTPEMAAEWIAPNESLPCDREAEGLPCAVTAGPHDEWCAVFAARRRWISNHVPAPNRKA